MSSNCKGWRVLGELMDKGPRLDMWRVFMSSSSGNVLIWHRGMKPSDSLWRRRRESWSWHNNGVSLDHVTYVNFFEELKEDRARNEVESLLAVVDFSEHPNGKRKHMVRLETSKGSASW